MPKILRNEWNRRVNITWSNWAIILLISLYYLMFFYIFNEINFDFTILPINSIKYLEFHLKTTPKKIQKNWWIIRVVLMNKIFKNENNIHQYYKKLRNLFNLLLIICTEKYLFQAIKILYNLRATFDQWIKIV